MPDDSFPSQRLKAATPAEQSLHNNFVRSVRDAKKALVRSAFYFAELVDRNVHKALGYRDAATYAHEAAGLTPTQARDLLRMRRKLRDLPVLAEAVDRGRCDFYSVFSCFCPFLHTPPVGW